MRLLPSRVLYRATLPSLVVAVAIAATASACQNAWSGVVSIERSAPYQDPARLAKAFALPAAASYRHSGLIEQRHITFCGPASIASALSSFGQGQQDQEQVLDGTDVGYWSVRLRGMTLDELGRVLAQRSGHQVTVLRNLDHATFIAHLRQSNQRDKRYLINFHRGPLFGRGGGHHSPIGGYLADEDLVLVLDVNGDFKPWLVPAARLYEAMDTIDSATGQKRGLVRIE